MRVLVTGGGGFLGSAICRRLLTRGDEVRSLSRSAYPELTKIGVEVVRGNIVNAEHVLNAAEGCDVVVHTAAKAGVWGTFEEFHQTNVVGTENVLLACKTHGIKRLVYTSSPSVVHQGGDMAGVDESVPYPDHYEADYPRTKAMAERLVLRANGVQGLRTVALRPHLIWGPGDNHLVPRILEKGRAGRLRQVGAGKNLVDAVYVDNAAFAHLLAADRLTPGSPICGKAYFIAQGEPVPLWELVNRILAAGGLPPVRKSISPRLAYLAGWILELSYGLLHLKSEPPMTRFVARQLSTSHWFDLTAARRDLDYEPEISLDEGMQRLAASLQGAEANAA